MKLVRVSPLRGEWIEIYSDKACGSVTSVSPLRGEWIEIHIRKIAIQRTAPRLSEASGLK